MKNLKNLKGAQILSKSQQKGVKGGKTWCKYNPEICPPAYYCDGVICVPDYRF